MIIQVRHRMIGVQIKGFQIRLSALSGRNSKIWMLKKKSYC
jgi:hypothetical protein